MAASDVHLFEMRDTAVTRGNCNVLELNVHVVFGLNQLSAVYLAGCDLERNDVARSLIEELDGYSNRARHFCRSN